MSEYRGHKSESPHNTNNLLSLQKQGFIFFLESFFFPIQMTIVTLLDQLSFKSKVLGYNQSAFFFGNFIEKRKLALSFSHQLKVVTE